jgi:activator of HSP90 ATPase
VALTPEHIMLDRLTRREFSASVASFVGLGLIGGRSAGVLQGGGQELTKTSEAIHQEVVFNATPKRLYQALTDAKEFTKVTTFSSVKNAPPAQIARAVGGAFSLFGGHITGRHVELVPNQRVVQAWRAADWPAGVYSIVRFELADRAGKTAIIFDHTGFPNGQGEHLAQGWYANYWEPLKKYLA